MSYRENTTCTQSIVCQYDGVPASFMYDCSISSENLSILRRLARDAVLDYMTRTGIPGRFPTRVPHPEVQRIVRNYFSAHNFDDPHNVIEKYVQLGLNISGTSYYYVPSHHAQAQIAIATAFATLFDDGFMGEKAMNEMLPRFYARRPQLHPMLDYYIESLTSGMQPFFSVYSANAIASSFLEYCNSEMFLRSHKDMSLIADSSIYIEYIRTKEGFAEAYAAFIWPECVCPDPKEYVQAIPDAMTFVCLVNDILSYYKEAKTGETGGHILSYAKVHNVTEIEALHALIDQTVTIVNRIRSLVGNGKAREAWECFLAGYTQFHLCTERYQLKEIVPEYC